MKIQYAKSRGNLSDIEQGLQKRIILGEGIRDEKGELFSIIFENNSSLLQMLIESLQAFLRHS